MPWEYQFRMHKRQMNKNVTLNALHSGTSSTDAILCIEIQNDTDSSFVQRIPLNLYPLTLPHNERVILI